MDEPLPEFIAPMLAQIGEPFDSDDYFFEIKWDGTRAIALIEESTPAGYRLHNRRKFDMFPRYPELEFLAGLPPGTALDGEIVVLRDGKPSFHDVMKRDHARSAARIRTLMQTHPVHYVVFDLLYQDHAPLFAAPLSERRERLQAMVAACGHERLVLSDGITGAGQHFFEQACERDLEGVVAKRLASRYRPGQRSDSWLKIKRSEVLYCVIIGWVASGDDLRSLIVAIEEDGQLRCVGRVGSGIGATEREQLLTLLHERPRSEPICPCDITGHWVEPDLFCSVSYLERTPNGELRAPVFQKLLVD